MYSKKKIYIFKASNIHMKTTEVIILFLILKRKFFNKVYTIEQSRQN